MQLRLLGRSARASATVNTGTDLGNSSSLSVGKINCAGKRRKICCAEWLATLALALRRQNTATRWRARYCRHRWAALRTHERRHCARCSYQNWPCAACAEQHQRKLVVSGLDAVLLLHAARNRARVLPAGTMQRRGTRHQKACKPWLPISSEALARFGIITTKAASVVSSMMPSAGAGAPRLVITTVACVGHGAKAPRAPHVITTNTHANATATTLASIFLARMNSPQWRHRQR